MESKKDIISRDKAKIKKKGDYMNILYRTGTFNDDLDIEILEELRRKGIFQKCTLLHSVNDTDVSFSEDYYRTIYTWIGLQTAYNAICNYDELPAVSKEIWEAMLPYKSTILELSCRDHGVHVRTYDEMEMLYIKHVRFWNWILDTDKIGFCFFGTAPGHSFEYTVYALAKVKNIPILVINNHWVLELSSVATDLSNLGSSAAICYNKYDDIEMDEVARSFYERIANKHIVSDDKKKKEILSSAEVAEEYKRFQISPSDRRQQLEKMKKRLNKGDEPYVTIRSIWNCQDNVKYAIRQEDLLKEEYRNLDFYNNNFAVEVSLDDKYILFPLQAMPDISIMPLAGVFVNQITTIQLLAEAANERGIKVYVKEHWYQWVRNERFYQEISMIPNVYLVRADINNEILMDKAYMVASQTGTCIVESFIRCIPCLIFAYNASAEAPGVYYVGSKAEILNAIDEVDTGKRASVEEAKKYFAAICKTSVRNDSYLEVHRYSARECITDIVDVIRDYVGKGMPDEYYYENKNLRIR